MNSALLPILFVTNITILYSATDVNGSIVPKILGNDTLVIQKITDDLEMPSALEFVDKDMLVIGNEDDKVKLIKNFDLKKYPVLDVNTFNSENESRLLGISSTIVDNKHYVFLFYSEQALENDPKESSARTINRVYRYEWNATGLELANPALILDLPSAPPSARIAGKIIVGPDNQLYTVINDTSGKSFEQNTADVDPSNDLLYDNKSKRSAVLKTDLSGQPAKNNPFAEQGFERYYAYGILESFDMAFDPVTGLLWDLEKGPGEQEEINFVRSGFNGDWQSNNIEGSASDQPKFVWYNSSSVTALTFINSTALGNGYVNDLLVGDLTGNISHFELDESRQALSRNGFASGFGPISDLKIGPDGALYVLTFSNDSGLGNQSGSVYKVAKASAGQQLNEPGIIQSDYGAIIGILVIAIVFILLSYRYKKLRYKEV